MKAYELYQDSLMCVLDHASFEYRHKEASYYITVNPQKADTLFSKLLKSEKVGTTNYAMITGAYSTLCKRQQRYEEEQKLLILSAITDIRNATRENESMQMLALKEYENQHLAPPLNTHIPLLKILWLRESIFMQLGTINLILLLIPLIRNNKPKAVPDWPRYYCLSVCCFYFWLFCSFIFINRRGKYL